MERDPLALDDYITEDRAEGNEFCCQVCNLVSIGFTNFTERVKSEIIKAGRPQPKLEFLTVTGKNCTRCFNPNSYQRYEWLTGCERLAKVFCWPCLLFCKKSSQWITTGLSDLNNISCSLKRHATTQVHIESSLRLKTFGKIWPDAAKSPDPLECLKIANEEQVMKDKEIIKSLIRLLCFLSNNPSRDSLREVDPADPIGRNRFVDFFNFMTKFEVTLKNNENSKSYFLSNIVRNNLITSISNTVFEKIKGEIDSSHFVSIIMNEVVELGETILVSIIVRFTTEQCLVCERFFGFHQVPSSRLAGPLFDVFSSVVKVTDRCRVVSYSYDGGVILTDQLPLFQSRADELCPNSLNVHYIEHQLSSVLAQSLSSIKECKQFFSTLNSLSSIFLKSNKLCEELSLLLERHYKMVKPNASDFNWTQERFLIKDILEIRQPLIELFENISRSEGEWDFETVFFTTGYLTILKNDLSFNLLLLLLSKVFALADELSTVLKNSVVDVKLCLQKVKEFTKFLQTRRDSFYLLYEETLCLISSGEPPLKKIKSEECLQSSSESYKTLYENVLWNMISHLNCRFRDLPKLQFISFKDIKPIKGGKGISMVSISSSLSYISALSNLRVELNVLSKNQPINKSSPRALLKYLRRMNLESTFPQTVSFCLLCLTLAVWNKRNTVFDSINNYIKRTNISHQLSNLTILSIEKEMVDKLLKQPKFYDEVIAEFIKKEPSVTLALTV